MDEREAFEALFLKRVAGARGRRQVLRAAALGLGGLAGSYLAACAPGAPTGPTGGPTAAPAAQPTSAAQPGAGAAPSGSVRFLVAESFWANWHPFLHTAQIQNRLQRQIFDRLVEFETDDFTKVAPALAREWRQVDETTWEL